MSVALPLPAQPHAAQCKWSRMPDVRTRAVQPQGALLARLALHGLLPEPGSSPLVQRAVV